MCRCGYKEEITRYHKSLVTASLDIYDTAIKELLPTPTKMHYIFNLRDLSKVFQGIQSAATTVDDPGELLRLWTHEMLRVFHDRLVDDTDREWLVALLREKSELHFKQKFHVIMEHVMDGGTQVKHVLYNIIRGPPNFKTDAVEFTGSCTSAMPQGRGFHSPRSRYMMFL